MLIINSVKRSEIFNIRTNAMSIESKDDAIFQSHQL